MFYLLVFHKSNFLFQTHCLGTGWDSRMSMVSIPNPHFNPQSLNKISELLLLSVNSSKTEHNQCDSRCLFLEKVWLCAPLLPPFYSWTAASTCPPRTTLILLLWFFYREKLDISIAFIQLSQMQLFTSCIYSIHLCKLWMYIRLSSSLCTQASPGLRACKLTLLLGGLISCRVSYFYCDSLWRTYSYLLERQKCKLISEAATEAAEDSHGDVVSASNYHSFSPPFGFPFQSSMSRAVDKLMETLEFFHAYALALV